MGWRPVLQHADPLRSVATKDIEPLVQARRETSEPEYIALLRSRFLPRS